MEDDALTRVAASVERIRSAHAQSNYGRRAIFTSAALVDPAPSLPAVGYVHRPFTHAVLNPQHKDILDFVRDADELEASLFAPAPMEPATATAAERIHRAPARRAAPPPPTPLRPQARGTAYSSLALLQAASSLTDGQDGLTRVKKQIASLTSKSSEIETARRRFQAHAAKMQAALDERRRSGDPGNKENAQAVADVAVRARNEENSREIATLKQALKHEELELFAIEQLKRDLLDQRKKNTAAQSAQLAEEAASSSHASPAPALEADSSNLLDESFPFASSAARDDAAPSADSAPRESLSDVQEPLQPEAEPEPEAGQELADAATVTGAETEETDRPLPSSTAELERVSEKIWALWGGVLGYVWPGRETGDFVDTLQGLEVLLGQRAGSETGPRLPQDAVPPRANELISAFVLASLLRAPEPHTVEFDHLKLSAGNWWDFEGRAQLRSLLEPHLSPDEIQRELDHSGESLATRAVYGLQAKKLLMVRRKAGKSPVGFSGL